MKIHWLSLNLVIENLPEIVFKQIGVKILLITQTEIKNEGKLGKIMRNSIRPHLKSIRNSIIRIRMFAKRPNKKQLSRTRRRL